MEALFQRIVIVQYAVVCQSKTGISAYTRERMVVGIEGTVSLCGHAGMTHYNCRMGRDEPRHGMSRKRPLVDPKRLSHAARWPWQGCPSISESGSESEYA